MMNRSEMIEKANVIRNRDHFGAMTPEEIAALPGTERVFTLPYDDHQVTVYELQPDQKPESPSPLLINLHGGGFLKGRSDRDHRYCSYLAENLRCIVWDVDYSLAPEYPFPTAVNECYSIAAYAFEHAEELGFDPKRIAIGGHSAGGNLSAAVMIQASRNGTLPFCCALMEYFPADFTANAVDKLSPAMAADPWWVKRAQTEQEYTSYYLNGEEDKENPLCAVLKASEEELASFPDSLIISAGEDTLLKETEAFGQRLIAAGVTVTSKRIKEARHGFTTNRTDGWERALQLQISFFRSHFE